MLKSLLSLKPRSIRQLTVTGFLTVAGVLIIALVITARQIDDLGTRSQSVLSLSAQGIEAVRALIDQSTAMERNARQYLIIGDINFLNVYLERRRNFLIAADQLAALSLDADMLAEVELLKQDEARNHQLLLDAPKGGSDDRAYQPQRENTYALSDRLGNWTSQQLALIQQETANTQGLLRLQAIVLTAMALVLAAVFTRLITRPLVQIEKAINKLGSGSYDSRIVVEGPADLGKLGSSLDWLRSRLQKLEQQRSAFFRHVSHELKTPLASIQESASLLRDGVAGPINAEQLKLLGIHNNNCQRLQGLIGDLLRYQAEIQSVLSAMPQPVKLDKVIEKVVDSHEFALETAKLRTESSLAPLIVLGDAEQLRVIVDNLLTNAIKFSPEGGKIRIDLNQREGSVVLEVEDQGPGIPDDQQELIFQAFYQGATPARSLIKSSGLGLAIVQEYVSANRGIIEVVPCATGALFRVSFPIQAG